MQVVVDPAPYVMPSTEPDRRKSGKVQLSLLPPAKVAGLKRTWRPAKVFTGRGNRTSGLTTRRFREVSSIFTKDVE